jgi:hydroxymethylpyrimidine pyrophosphatase-like HAD family hydrolase
MYIAVDFDGTCVTHDYPNIGKDIGAVPVLKKLTDSGHKIILNTMRSGDKLKEAMQWFTDNNIPLYGANENPTQKSWTESQKVFANLYIDDAALGCPLIFDHAVSSRPFVNWNAVEEYLEKTIIKK